MSVVINGTNGVTYNDGTIQATAPAQKNKIINGNMLIAQRATSVTGITSSSGTYSTMDRFQDIVRTVGTWTQTQDTDVPTGQGFATSLKMDCTTANGSLSADSWLRWQTQLEGFNCQPFKFGTANAESITLSFWVKSNKTGTYCIELYQSSSGRAISKSYTIDSANTYEKKELTFVGDTVGTINNDNGSGFIVTYWFAAGANYQSGTLQTSWGAITTANRAVGQVNLADSTSNYINITGLQLETGVNATDFEHLQYGQQLALCQRYYEVVVDGNDGIGLQIVGLSCYTYKVDQINMPYNFKTEKRANGPTLEYVSGSYYDMRTHSSTVTSSSLGVTGSQTGRQNASPYFNTSGQTEHESWAFYITNTAAHIAFSSEL